MKIFIIAYFMLASILSFELNAVVQIRFISFEVTDGNRENHFDQFGLKISGKRPNQIKSRLLKLAQLNTSIFSQKASIYENYTEFALDIINLSNSKECQDLPPTRSNWVNISKKEWQNYTIVRFGLQLQVEAKFSCRSNRYGTFCQIFCRAGSTHNCSSEGNIICHDGWNGPFCEKAICEGGCPGGDRSKCISPNKCACTHGWEGSTCNQCIRSSLCAHGFCTQPLGCACRPGWSGPYCNVAIFPMKRPNNCSCHNGGLCEFIESTQQVQCLCPAYYSGNFCEVPVSLLETMNICEPRFCQNGGECFSNGRTAVCQCNRKWTGVQCEIPIHPCMSNPCFNNGTCITPDDRSAEFECICPNEFHGLQCELKRASMRFTLEHKYTESKARISILIAGLVVLIICCIISTGCFIFSRYHKIEQRKKLCVIEEEAPPPPYDAEESTGLLSMLTLNKQLEMRNFGEIEG